MIHERFKNFIVITSILGVVIIGLIAGLVAFDLALHKKFDKAAGLNYRGYRGEVIGKKEPQELRIGLFGGSIVLGYGRDNEHSIAGFLQDFMDDKAMAEEPREKYTVFNLAMYGETSCVYFKSNYSQFRHLDLDILIFYLFEGKGRLSESFIQNPYSLRTTNWAFRNFNYYFHLPLYMREKYFLLRYGSIEKGYREDNLVVRLEEFFSARRKRAVTGKSQTLCEFVDSLTREGKFIIFAFAPYEVYEDKIFWSDLKGYFDYNFSNNPNVITADLRAVFSDDKSESYFFDSFHYNENGNRTVAQALLAHINKAITSLK